MFKIKNIKENIGANFSSGLVVFLVALPLCLGIAMASGAPLYAGLISGIIGGIIVGAISNSALGVSGPAAGLAVIVLNSINELGSFESFLLTVIIAGVIQLIIGFLKAGFIAYYFPSSVIHGMLAGIGLIIFLKQIPHAFGYNKDPEGDLEFIQPDHQNTFSELFNMIDFISPSVLIITVLSLIVLIGWELKFVKQSKIGKLIPAPLIVVGLGILLNQILGGLTGMALLTEHLVSLPVATNASDFFGNFTFPDFSQILNPQIYITAVIIAIVGSLETLLSVEAIDKQDSLKRITPTNLELKAQGIGNIISGLIGGLPITQVIVRSSANQQAGGKSKGSTIIHGILLLASILFIPKLLNQIPLATLAAILLVIGYKLAKPALFIKMYKQGWEQFIPFVITIIMMLVTDLLVGVTLGLVISIFVILRNNFKTPFLLENNKLIGNSKIKMTLSEDVTFINKAALLKVLKAVSNNSEIHIDASKSIFIHHDIIEIIENFTINAKLRNITVTVTGLYKNNSQIPVSHFKINPKN